MQPADATAGQRHCEIEWSATVAKLACGNGEPTYQDAGVGDTIGALKGNLSLGNTAVKHQVEPPAPKGAFWWRLRGTQRAIFGMVVVGVVLAKTKLCDMGWIWAATAHTGCDVRWASRASFSPCLTIDVVPHSSIECAISCVGIS